MEYTGALWSGTRITRNPLSSLTSRNQASGSSIFVISRRRIQHRTSPKHMARPATRITANLRFHKHFLTVQLSVVYCAYFRRKLGKPQLHLNGLDAVPPWALSLKPEFEEKLDCKAGNKKAPVA